MADSQWLWVLKVKNKICKGKAQTRVTQTGGHLSLSVLGLRPHPDCLRLPSAIVSQKISKIEVKVGIGRPLPSGTSLWAFIEMPVSTYSIVAWFLEYIGSYFSWLFFLNLRKKYPWKLSWKQKLIMMINDPQGCYWSAGRWRSSEGGELLIMRSVVQAWPVPLTHGVSFGDILSRVLLSLCSPQFIQRNAYQLQGNVRWIKNNELIFLYRCLLGYWNLRLRTAFGFSLYWNSNSRTAKWQEPKNLNINPVTVNELWFILYFPRLRCDGQLLI